MLCVTLSPRSASHSSPLALITLFYLAPHHYRSLNFTDASRSLVTTSTLFLYKHLLRAKQIQAVGPPTLRSWYRSLQEAKIIQTTLITSLSCLVINSLVAFCASTGQHQRSGRTKVTALVFAHYDVPFLCSDQSRHPPSSDWAAIVLIVRSLSSG